MPTLTKLKPTAKKETRSLKHEFSDEEMSNMADNMSSNQLEIIDLEAKKKAEAKKYKEAIDELKLHNNRLAQWHHDKHKYQDTAIEVMYNYPEDGRKTITRMDTNDQWVEDMTDYENSLDNLPEMNGQHTEEE